MGDTVQFSINLSLMILVSSIDPFPVLILSQVDKLSHHLIVCDNRSGYKGNWEGSFSRGGYKYYCECEYIYCYLLQPNNAMPKYSDLKQQQLFYYLLWSLWVKNLESEWLGASNTSISGGCCQTQLELEKQEIRIHGGWPDISLSM